MLLLLRTAVLLSQCEEAPSPSITIHDENFLAALIEAGVDQNDNGKISPSEEAVTFLT